MASNAEQSAADQRPNLDDNQPIGLIPATALSAALVGANALTGAPAASVLVVTGPLCVVLLAVASHDHVRTRAALSTSPPRIPRVPSPTGPSSMSRSSARVSRRRPRLSIPGLPPDVNWREVVLLAGALLMGATALAAVFGGEAPLVAGGALIVLGLGASGLERRSSRRRTAGRRVTVPRVAMAGGGLLIMAAGASQAILPAVAERHLRDRLSPMGEVRNVQVAALPAAKMLFGRFDRLTLDMGTLDAHGAQQGGGPNHDVLRQVRGISQVDARIASLAAGPIELSGMEVTKRGDRLEGRAVLDPAKIEAALAGQMPGATARTDISSSGDLLVRMSVPSEALGPFASQIGEGGLQMRMRLFARDGQIVASIGGNLPFSGHGGAAGSAGGQGRTQTLMDNDQLRVESLKAAREGDRIVLRATGAVA